MDPTTEHYIEECRRPGSRLRFAGAEVRLPPSLARTSGQRLLPRPLFVAERDVRGFAEDVVALFDLLLSVPERFFDGDTACFCAALGLDERVTGLMLRSGGGPPPRYGRADMYHDGTAFRLLEFNIAGQIGGVDRAGRIPRALLDVPAFGSFAAARGLGHTDTGRKVAEALRAAGAAVTGGREPVVVLVEEPGGLAKYRSSWEPLQELMRGFEVDFRLGEVDGIRLRNGRLYHREERVDVVVRGFGVEEVLADPEVEAVMETLARAHLDGRAVLWAPLESHLYGDKACLAMLADPDRRGALSPAERELVDRILPPTRRLDDAALDHGREHRAELVLKPSRGYGGIGVVAGWEASAREWERALAAGREAGAVLQQRVLPRAEPVVDPESGRLTDWQASWGLFLTPAGYAGAYARALPAGDGAVIGITGNPATRTAGVFTFGEAEEAGKAEVAG